MGAQDPKITEVLPLLYLHGLSSGDFVPALGQFLGSAAGLSAPVITRLTETWKAEQRIFAARDLSGVDYVYLWADGIHVNIRLEEHKLCLLVMIGVRADGRKELIALADGYRESTESWADLLRDCARRGMRAPVLAAGDGALGFWGALREVFPGTKDSAAGSTRSPTSSGDPQVRAPRREEGPRRDLGAEDKPHARAAARAFEAAYAAKFPKATAKITDDLDQLLRLRLPCRALDPPAHDQPNRIYVRHGKTPDQDHQGSRLAGCRARHGVPADRVSPGPLARGQRAASRRPGPRRSDLHQRQTRRTTGGDAPLAAA